jgi:ribonuclease VapC
MFVDASVLVAMMTNESDAGALSERLSTAVLRLTSPMALWEASIAYSRISGVEPKAALREVEAYIRPLGIEVIAISPAATAAAVAAYQRYGKGRHPAALNFGDCFAYACARQLDVPLLYKGDDFSQTDIETA